MDGERDSFDDLLLVDSTFPSFRFDKWMDVCEGRRGGGGGGGFLIKKKKILKWFEVCKKLFCVFG